MKIMNVFRTIFVSIALIAAQVNGVPKKTQEPGNSVVASVVNKMQQDLEIVIDGAAEKVKEAIVVKINALRTMELGALTPKGAEAIIAQQDAVIENITQELPNMAEAAGALLDETEKEASYISQFFTGIKNVVIAGHKSSPLEKYLASAVIDKLQELRYQSKNAIIKNQLNNEIEKQKIITGDRWSWERRAAWAAVGAIVTLMLIGSVGEEVAPLSLGEPASTPVIETVKPAPVPTEPVISKPVEPVMPPTQPQTKIPTESKKIVKQPVAIVPIPEERKREEEINRQMEEQNQLQYNADKIAVEKAQQGLWERLWGTPTKSQQEAAKLDAQILQQEALLQESMAKELQESSDKKEANKALERSAQLQYNLDQLKREKVALKEENKRLTRIEEEQNKRLTRIEEERQYKKERKAHLKQKEEERIERRNENLKELGRSALNKSEELGAAALESAKKAFKGSESPTVWGGE